MKELFYIVEVGTDEEWYRLHYLPTHHCLGGCGDYHQLLNTIKRLVVRYKKEDRITKVVEKVCGKLSSSTLEQYISDYEECTTMSDLVEEVVEEALEKVKNSSPLMRSIKKNRKSKKVLITSNGTTTTTDKVQTTTRNVPEEVVEVKARRPLLLSRHTIR